MGLIYSTLKFSNPLYESLSPIETICLVDTGAVHLCIPEHIAYQLNLQELEKREVELADGRKKLCSYVGPIKVQFANRSCFTGALVIGDRALVGSIPLEDMDLVVHPALQKLTVNPANPNIPLSIAKKVN